MGNLDKAQRIRQYGEVFTPLPTVREMLDTLEKQNPAIFDPQRTFLEPACGDGAFVVEILRRKFERCRRPGDYRVALESVYGFEIQPDNVAACISFYRPDATYGITWRCWDHMPTAEERAAHPWKEET